MRISSTALAAILSIIAISGAIPAAVAQAVSPVEIQEPDIRALQQHSINDLNAVGQTIAANHFNFPFYFSRKLDIDEKLQKRTDQHSIRFERYNGATVLAISGNYYGAYASEKFSSDQRAKETFMSVVLPILKVAVPAFQNSSAVQGYAIEVSHHVIGKTMGMPIERPENLMVYLPQSAARKLVAAQGNLAQQVALVDAEVFLNAKQMTLWLTEDEQPGQSEAPPAMLESSSTGALQPPAQVAETASARPPYTPAANPPLSDSLLAAQPAAVAPPQPVAPPPPALRDTSPQALAALQTSIQGISNHMLKELEPAAHFVAYAPPAFIPFRHQAYLELSVTTALAEPQGVSRYKAAALAFDEHISPLIRRVLGYFPGDQNFDGISFSTTVRGRTKPGVPVAAPLSVEFFFPMEVLRSYEAYDCTGQQLIDAGVVLINGERARLDLEPAEGSAPSAAGR